MNRTTGLWLGEHLLCALDHNVDVFCFVLFFFNPDVKLPLICNKIIFTNVISFDFKVIFDYVIHIQYVLYYSNGLTVHMVD